jgi:IS5 family transposase
LRGYSGWGRKAADALTTQFNELEQSVSFKAHAPSRRAFLQQMTNQIRTDLCDVERVLEYTDNRVFHDKTLPSKEKVLSLSDGSAAYIKKGDRDPVIGYKPQLVRSGNGFVTSLVVPQGNAADCSELVPSISDSIRRTGIVPESVSTDDGYASAKGRDGVLEMGVDDISISGSKGKKLTTLEKWHSEIYRNARRNRSAVESLMFTIKDGFEFGEVGRRGLEYVRDELLEKVMAYNCCRIVRMKKRRREKLARTA